MAITITSVTGVGGSPPTSIRITGTKQNCEEVRVTTPCSSVVGLSPDANWEIDLPNDLNCPCGTMIQVTATCVGGTRDDEVVFLAVLQCDETCCPRVRVSSSVAGCAPTTAQAAFTVAPLVFPMNCDPVAPTSFVWTLNGPTGKKFQITTMAPSVDTTVQWIDDATSLPAMVQFPTGGAYSISVTVVVPGFASPPCILTDSQAFTVPACAIPKPNPPCPTLTIMVQGMGCVDPDPSHPMGATLQFVAVVNDPAGITTSIEWDFGDPASAGNTFVAQPPFAAPVSHTFAMAGPRTITARAVTSAACTNRGSQTATTTVTIAECPCPSGQTRNATTNKCEASPPSCPPGQHRDASGTCVPDQTSSSGCDVLLWIALVLILLSGIAAVVGCILSEWFPQQAAIIGYVAIGVLAVGLLLFGLWSWLCSKMTACPIILSAIDFVSVLIAIFAVIGIALGLIALGGWKLEFLICMAVSWIQSAIWGILLAILYQIAVAVGCLVKNPSGSPHSSSSSGLGAADDRVHRPRSLAEAAFGRMTTRLELADAATTGARRLVPLPWLAADRVVGFGDAAKRLTSAFGIRPCAPCLARAERLDRQGAFVGAPRRLTR